MHDILQCRLCAEFIKEDHLININSDTAKNLNLEYKITKCFNLSFQDVRLPKNVCLMCCNKVSIVFEFQEQVRKAQEILQYSVVVVIDEKSGQVKEEVEELSHFDDQFTDYVPNLLTENNDNKENNCIKKEENCSENDVTSLSEPIETKIKDEQHEEREPKKNIRRKLRTRKKAKQNQKREKKSLDPEEAADRALRTERIRLSALAWKSYKWECCICHEELPSVEDLRTHFKNVHDKTPQYTCMQCSKVYNSYQTFKEHNRSHWKANDYNYRCDICSRLFFLKKQYDAHLEKHNSDKQDECKNMCAVCGKNFKYSFTLTAHIRQQHSNQRVLYKCETCNQTLKSKTQLKYHKKSHQGEKDFTCDQCGKSYLDPSTLKLHLNVTHSNEKQYSCSLCPQKFKFRQSLNLHLESHTDKRYECEVCNKQFTRKQNLKMHASIHTGDLPFPCDFCEKKFRTKERLKVHRRQHTGERPYSCTKCNHFFTDSANYTKHLKGKHGYIPRPKLISERYQTSVKSQSTTEVCDTK